MPRKVGHVIHDILEAIDRVEEVTRGKTLSDFENSWQLRWLVQRAIEIISEASRGIPKDLTATRPEIPWQRVQGSATFCGMNTAAYRTELSGTSSSTSYLA
jgi:uncharacterized protein with HEPN domain